MTLRGIPAAYQAWARMIQRCSNPADPSYPHYGGRGITVCERWLSFPAFLADMGRRPGGKLTLERLDLNRPYMPENCRWARPMPRSRRRAAGDPDHA